MRYSRVGHLVCTSSRRRWRWPRRCERWPIESHDSESLVREWQRRERIKIRNCAFDSAVRKRIDNSPPETRRKFRGTNKNIQFDDQTGDSRFIIEGRMQTKGIDKLLSDGAVALLELIWNRNVNNRRREDLQVTETAKKNQYEYS